MIKREKSFVLFLLSLSIWFTVGCKDKYEKIRRNPDPNVRYQEAIKLFDKGNYEKSQYLLEDLIGYYRGDPKAEDIYFKYSYTQYHTRNYAFASHYFKQFYSTFPNSANAEEALYMSAYSSYKQSPIYRLDQSDTQKAMEGFQFFANTYPTSSRLTQCNEILDELQKKLEEKSTANAALYYRIGNYKAALHSYQNILKEFPETSNAEKIRLMVLKSDYELAKNSVEEKQKSRFQEVVGLYYEFIDMYPSSPYKKDAENIFSKASQKLKLL